MRPAAARTCGRRCRSPAALATTATCTSTSRATPAIPTCCWRHRLVFAACDTGFAPIKSLIEHALSLDASPSLSLYWLATRSDGHFLANQCRAWSQALDVFEYAAFNEADAAAGARQVAAAIRADLFDIECGFYLAGPEAFVATLGHALADAGVPAAQIATEIV